LTLVLKYNLSREEYLDYNYFTAWSSPSKRKYRVKYYLQVSTFYIAIAGLYMYANRSDSILLHVSVFFTIGVLYFVLVPFIVRRSIKSKVKIILSQPANQHVLGATEVVLTENGITDRDSASETTYSWDQIVRRAETKLCYYLYTNAYHAIVIPRRLLHAGKEDAFKKLLDTHLPLSSDFRA
jgi:YcxB-like protein